MSKPGPTPDARHALRLFRTPPHKCSYLDQETATTIFVDPEIIPSIELLSELSDLGFRRSGSHLYRPDCESCSACVSVRIPVTEFKPSKRFRRVLSRNSDVAVRALDSIASNEEALALYTRYINTRHQDGDMYPATKEQFDSFILSTSEATRFFGFYLDDRLICIAVCDQLLQGLSAVYTFFDPDKGNRSLGSFAILWMIQAARENNLPYVYLGYWVKECPKMEYKLDYRPIELLRDKRWIRIS